MTSATRSLLLTSFCLALGAAACGSSSDKKDAAATGGTGGGGSGGSGGASGQGGVDAAPRDAAPGDAAPGDAAGAEVFAADVGLPPDGGVFEVAPTAPGPVPGPANDHCMGRVQEVDPAVCQAGPTPGVDAGPEEEHETNYNTEADDDDCKYRVSFSATPVARNADVFFTVNVKKKSDSMAMSIGTFEIEAVLGDTHPLPNQDPEPEAMEMPTGTVRFGPVRFDAAGRWTVRFHINDQCTDNDEATPHSHVAFYVNVP